MSKKRRPTDAWIQSEEGRFDPVVETAPNSKFVPVENIPSDGLSPEEICILKEEAPKLLAARNPEVREAAEELLVSCGILSLPEEEDPYYFLEGEEDRIFVAVAPIIPARGCEISRTVSRRYNSSVERYSNLRGLEVFIIVW